MFIAKERPRYALRASNGAAIRFGHLQPAQKEHMLWTILVVLLILWLLGFSFHVAGSLIHLLLVIAVMLLFNLVGRRRSA